MGAAKPSKKQRGKQNAAAKDKKKATADGGRSKQHVKFDDDGEKVTKTNALQKKRARAATGNAAAEGEKKEGGGKADRSPEMIQQAKYYLEQWKSRDEPPPEGELPWKFKVTERDALRVLMLDMRMQTNRWIRESCVHSTENEANVDSPVDVRSRRGAEVHVFDCARLFERH